MSDSTGQTAEQDQQQGEPNGTDAPPNGPQNGNEQTPAQGGTNQQTEKPDTGDGEDWKGRSRQWEQRSKDNKKTADDALAERDRLSNVLEGLRKHLDPDGAGKDDDPAIVAQRAAEARDTALGEARLARVELAAERAARRAGADVDALLDSRTFLDKLAKLDPSEDEFGDKVKDAVKKALSDNPRLKATPPPPPASATGEMNGGSEAPKSGPKSVEDWRKRRRER